MSSWETWVAFFRDSIQNQMVNDPELKQSLMKECSTKVAVCNPGDGTILASDPEKSDMPRVVKQPIRTRYLGHVTGYQPIRDQYFLIRSVPGNKHSILI
eukprot:sb/3478799/